MAENDLISIVITTHGRGDRLGCAVRSAINQSYDNIEIIVVDDNGDCREEREKTEKIVKKYTNVSLIKNDRNLGGALSRNVGFRAAKGNWISFLDDDDQYLPGRVEKLYEILKSHEGEKIGLVYCSCDAIDENGNKITEYVRSLNGRPFYQHMLNCIAGTSMWLVSKQALEEIGGFDDMASDEDSAVILKMLIAGYEVLGTSDKLVLYLEHSGQRLSGTKISNAIGMMEYRERCRKQYFRLTKKQIARVECNFSDRLITIYLLNNKLNEAKREFANLIKYGPFSRVCHKNAMKILFWRKYVDRILARRRGS